MHQALMKATEKNPRHRLKIYVGLLIVIIAFGASISFLNLEGFSQDIRSHADQSATDINCPKPPDCCIRMASSHDPFECGWPIRGYCTLDICNGIEGHKQNCGWYWIWHDMNDNEYKIGTNAPNGYGCMIGDSEATMRPIYSPFGATVTPIPLASPTPTSTLPTSTPIIIQPTSTPLPTQLLIPTVSTTNPVIQPSAYYLSPTLPAIGGGGSPVPTNYIQPTNYNQQLSITPKPTREPIIPKIEKQINSFFQEIKIQLSKFISNVLP